MTAREKIERIRSGKLLGVGDVIFILGLASLVCLLLYVMYRPATADELLVSVRINGQVYGSYRLENDIEVDIDGKLTLVIANNLACVKDPICSDRVCVGFGKISRVHETIVCAPEGITIRITGVSDIHAGAR